MDMKLVRPYTKYYDSSTWELLSIGTATYLDLGAVAGTGGLVSTIQDEAIFYQTLFNETSKGFPLLHNASSQDAILTPYTPVPRDNVDASLFLVGGFSDFYLSYCQGIMTVCIEEGCPNGDPDWIVYMGSTFTANTVNIMDYRHGGDDHDSDNMVMPLSQVLQTNIESYTVKSKQVLEDVQEREESMVALQEYTGELPSSNSWMFIPYKINEQYYTKYL